MRFPDKWFQRKFDQTGDFEPHSREAALRHVTQWGCALDVGAHCGIWTDRLCDVFETVHAFEPHPVNFAYLRGNVKRGNAILHNLAIGEKRGSASMEPGPDDDPNQNSGQWHLSEGSAIRVAPLDEFGFTGVGFIKLDVEGFEWFALKGAEKTIKRDRPVVLIEENGLNKRYGIADGQCPALLESWGYERVDGWNKDHVFATR